MTIAIPLDPIPWQKLSVVLNDQACDIEVRQIGARLYASLIADGDTIGANVLAVNGGRVNLYPHPTFAGTLRWFDAVGDEPPQYEGLGSRWLLLYDEA